MNAEEFTEALNTVEKLAKGASNFDEIQGILDLMRWNGRFNPVFRDEIQDELLTMVERLKGYHGIHKT